METICLLLINPWIADFAAYNFWSEPLGLLYIASILKSSGARIEYIDCLTSHEEKNPVPKQDGRRKFLRRVIEKPYSLTFVPRNYAFYGINEEEFERRLNKIEKPHAVLVTSLMTYWYPGVFRVIEKVKKHFGNKIPVLLGGIYTKLCPSHARQFSGADLIITDERPSYIIRLLQKITGKNIKPTEKSKIDLFPNYPPPLHELQIGNNFFAVLTSRGCPYRCTYCASSLLGGNFILRTPESVITEIKKYSETLNTRNIVFYDDALLIEAENHIIPILNELKEMELGINFYLPNGVHAGLLNKKIAKLFKKAGVKTIRIGLETSNIEFQKTTGNKITNEAYKRAVEYLYEAGYQGKDIGTYIIAGIPGQSPNEVEESLRFVYNSGGAPYLAFFSPIPGTQMWEEAIRSNPLPISEEPLFHNNTVFILGQKDFSPDTVQYLKNIALQMRESFKT